MLSGRDAVPLFERAQLRHADDLFELVKLDEMRVNYAKPWFRVPMTFLEIFTKGNGNNDTGWSNPRYDELIRDRGLDGFITRPQVMAGMRHVFNQYVIRVPAESRDALMAHFKASQVACDIYYPLALHMQECLKHLNLGEGDFPESEAAAKSVLALPMYPDLTREIQERVTDTLDGFVKKHARKGKAA